MRWQNIISWALLFALFHGFALMFIYLGLEGFEYGIGFGIALMMGFWLYAGVFLIAPELLKSP